MKVEAGNADWLDAYSALKFRMLAGFYGGPERAAVVGKRGAGDPA